jgi:hypothetical protein
MYMYLIDTTYITYILDFVVLVKLTRHEDSFEMLPSVGVCRLSIH